MHQHNISCVGTLHFDPWCTLNLLSGQHKSHHHLPRLSLYWCYYPHRSRDSMSPVCGIFSFFLFYFLFLLFFQIFYVFFFFFYLFFFGIRSIICTPREIEWSPGCKISHTQCSQGCFRNTFVIHYLTKSSFLKISSRHFNSQTVRATNLKF